MKLSLYSIYDSKVEAYIAPNFARGDGEMIRMIQDDMENPRSNLAKYAEDYVLFQIGEFDDQSGVITPVGPKNLGSLVQWKKKLNPGNTIFQKPLGEMTDTEKIEAHAAALSRAQEISQHQN